MKRLFSLVCLLLLLAALFLGFLIKNFKPDQCRPQFQAYLQSLLGQEVELGPLSLDWKGIHPTFFAQGFTLRNPETHQVLVQSKKARADVRLSGILKYQILIDRFFLEEAHFSFLRQENGAWNWKLFDSKKSGPDFLRLSGWRIRIDSFEAAGASLYYADQSQLPYFHHEWRNLNIRLLQLDSEPFRIHLVPEKGLIRELTLRLLSPQQLHIKADLGPYGEGEGEIRDPFQAARFSAKGALRNADLKALFGEGKVQGEAEGSLEAAGEGFHPESLKRTLIVKGKADVKKGRFLSRQGPGELLKSISPFPGFSNLTRQPFKGKFESFSQNREIIFEKLSADYRLSNGKFFVENVAIEHPEWRMEADGHFNLMQDRLEMRGTCFFKGEFAAHLISRVRDMEVLSNAQQELEIPFFYKGPSEGFKPYADLVYIANRLIQVRGQELASRGVQKINEFLEGTRK